MGAEEVYWENYLVLVIDRMVRSMRAAINDDIADLGITSAQAPYLLALHIKDGQPMASLSTFLEMDRANTSRMIKSLQEMGMITTERPINNSRNVPVLLTAHGREVAEDLFDRMVALNRSFFAGISDKDFLRLRNTLIRVSRNLHSTDEGSFAATSFYEDLGVESVTGSKSLTSGGNSSRKIGNF